MGKGRGLGNGAALAAGCQGAARRGPRDRGLTAAWGAPGGPHQPAGTRALRPGHCPWEHPRALCCGWGAPVPMGRTCGCAPNTTQRCCPPQSAPSPLGVIPRPHGCLCPHRCPCPPSPGATQSHVPHPCTPLTVPAAGTEEHTGAIFGPWRGGGARGPTSRGRRGPAAPAALSFQPEHGEQHGKSLGCRQGEVKPLLSHGAPVLG